MGAKEENLPTRYVFGFSGQMTPVQVLAGKCKVCGTDVWITYKKPSREYRETVPIHHGCENQKEHQDLEPWQ